MKKPLIITSILLILSISLVSFIHQKTDTKRTEEYAIVDVEEHGKVKSINITIGDTKIDHINAKVEYVQDLRPVHIELNKLNEQGFEIVNVTSTEAGTTTSSSITPRHIFLLRRKI
jgi:hypothetical protein